MVLSHRDPPGDMLDQVPGGRPTDFNLTEYVNDDTYSSPSHLKFRNGLGYQGPKMRHTCPCHWRQANKFHSQLWNLKQSCDSVPALHSCVLDPVSSVQEPTQWQQELFLAPSRNHAHHISGSKSCKLQALKWTLIPVQRYRPRNLKQSCLSPYQT